MYYKLLAQHLGNQSEQQIESSPSQPSIYQMGDLINEEEGVELDRRELVITMVSLLPKQYHCKGTITPEVGQIPLEKNTLHVVYPASEPSGVRSHIIGEFIDVYISQTLPGHLSDILLFDLSPKIIQQKMKYKFQDAARFVDMLGQECDATVSLWQFHEMRQNHAKEDLSITSEETIKEGSQAECVDESITTK